MSIEPGAKPKLTQAELLERIKGFNIDRQKYPLLIVGIRGYYKRTMGDPTKNDWGIYDDAVFVISPKIFAPFNFNTDPSTHRPGYGKADLTKGMGQVKAGLWYYKFGTHNGKSSSYPALIPAKEMTVIRDGVEHNYEDSGWFGDNIHKGGIMTTGSEGCQTVPPGQWTSFYNTVVNQAKVYFGDKWKNAIIPYILIEE